MTKFFSIFLFLFLISFSTLASKPALVIVDMQELFIVRNGSHQLEANQLILKKLLESQIEAVRLAKHYQIPILVLKSEGFGKILKDLEQEFMFYPKARLIPVDLENKDVESERLRTIEVVLREFGGIETLIFMGANAMDCVKCNVKSVLRENYKVWTYSPGLADFNSMAFRSPFEYQEGISSMRTEPGDLFGVINGKAHLESVMRWRLRPSSCLTVLGILPKKRIQ